MSSATSAIASATSSIAAASSSAAAQLQAPKNLKVVGIILAIASGLLIGSSFVFKKKGLLRSQAGGELGEGVAYLKSPLWWTGMAMMILGEICNFAAYAFVEAIVVTPLGALSVVICAILSSFFLNEKLSFFGWLGCTLCIFGSVIIALNGPKEQSVGQIREFQKLFLSPGFLVYASILIAISLVIIFYFAPRYGKKSMLWYISVCSMIGGISVSVTTGLGSAIVTTALGDNQFKFWFIYFLMAFVAVTLVTEVYYLNVALALFNTAMVTPTYYVIFTFFSMVTTIVLFKGLQASATDIITLVMGFLVICVGITILQMSKVDPSQLSKLDRRSTILLQAARQHTEMQEKDLVGMEDPGMDALRGSFGTFGSIIRARTVKRMSQSSHAGRRPSGMGHSHYDSGHGASWLSHTHNESAGGGGLPLTDPFAGMKRHQLYDAPMPRLGVDDDAMSMKTTSSGGVGPNKKLTIKFGSQDLIHQYGRPGTGDDRAFHDRRPTLGSPRGVGGEAGYPPLPTIGTRTTIGSEMNLLDVEDGTDGSGSETVRPAHRREGAAGAATMPATPSMGSMLTVPRKMGAEHEVHSAPPTLYPSPRPGKLPVHKDSRELFDSPSSFTATARGTLLSFPSVTDSARSSGMVTEDAEKDKALEREKEKAREKERGRSAKRYPKGDREDDREESVSLWQQGGEGDRGSSSERASTEESSELPGGGIRLVQTSSRTGNRI